MFSFRYYSFIICALCIAILWGQGVDAAGLILKPTQTPNQAKPVHLTADSLVHDDKSEAVIATGHVELIQGGRILNADKMIYRLDTDTVTAIGNVSILDENGDVHFAEYVELNNQMKEGFVHGLLSTLTDGSRFTAVEARRANNKIIMKEASYTPCKVCEDGKDPLWQIKASEVTHDEETGDVNYKNARLEFFGVPLAYTPYFHHPDDSVKRKSGFLRPGGGWTTDLGGYADIGYYWNIAPDKDATFQIQPTLQQGILNQGEYRQRFVNGQVKFNGSVAVGSNRTEDDGRIERDRTRAHIFANGRFDLNNKWRAGFDLERTTDKEYLRLYDLSSKEVLESELYAERFSGRNYSRISALNFQDVRVGDRVDQPDILPVMEHNMLGKPKALMGGRWSLETSALGLHREDDGQDVMRGSLALGWQRRMVSDLGLKTTLDANVRGDVWSIRDRIVATAANGLDDDAKAFRALPQLQLTSSYPMVRNFEKAQVLVEPIFSAAIAPDLTNNDNDIPNEDSLDVQLDTTNLFDLNRFPGEDAQEDGNRVTYGVKTGGYSHDGRHARLFLGQSYRFEDDNLFPQGSGLEDNYSDIVGQIDMRLAEHLDVNYRFQLDHKNLASRRHELEASGGTDDLRLSSQYLFASRVDGTGFAESREQIRLGGSYRINDFWKVNTSTLTDLGEEPGLRKASIGMDYVDECFNFSLLGIRNLTSSVSGSSETTLLMRLGLKHLGEISTPEILLEEENN